MSRKRSSILRPSNLASPSRAGQFQVSWDAFVHLVIDATILAYKRMRAAKRARRDWPEDTFSAVLADDYLRPVAYKKSLRVISHANVHTEQIKSGEVSPRGAREIDIRLFGTWEMDYHKILFAWECKRISERATDSEHDNLVAEYVTEGITRFIDGVYAAAVNDAGMIGYILVGTAGNIVCEINKSMLEPKRVRPLTHADQLQTADARASFTDIFVSSHSRLSGDTIKLHHLFLTFDYP